MNNLAQELRKGTIKSHSMAENVTFIKSFLNGVIDKKTYRTLVANLYFVYSALEEELYNNRMNPMIKHIFFPELNRKESLEKDLEFYYGSNWEEQINPSAATNVYVERIQNIGKNQP